MAYPLDLPALMKSRLAWWDEMSIFDRCSICSFEKMMVKPLRLAGTGEGAKQLWIRRCLWCGGREEVDNHGRVPPTKEAQTQAGEKEFFLTRNTIRESIYKGFCH